MPTVEENKRTWNKTYDWEQTGSEWSAWWGGVDTQWYTTLLPRIHRYVPTGAVLEIATEFGRWTQFLKDLCRHLILVDVTEKCIQACKERFRDCSHIEYHVNDGKSLDFVGDD